MQEGQKHAVRVRLVEIMKVDGRIDRETALGELLAGCKVDCARCCGPGRLGVFSLVRRMFDRPDQRRRAVDMPRFRLYPLRRDWLKLAGQWLGRPGHLRPKDAVIDCQLT